MLKKAKAHPHPKIPTRASQQSLSQAIALKSHTLVCTLSEAHCRDCRLLRYKVTLLVLSTNVVLCANLTTSYWPTPLNLLTLQLACGLTGIVTGLSEPQKPFGQLPMAST